LAASAIGAPIIEIEIARAEARAFLIEKKVLSRVCDFQRALVKNSLIFRVSP
jgi:hypothetical protein